MERFRKLRRLGAGSMGVVYEALDLERGGSIAIKTLLRGDGEALLRFKREFRAFQDIEHPNLVSLHELIEGDGEWFFTMELVDGVDFLSHVWQTDARLVREGSFERAPTAPALDMTEGALLCDERLLRDALGQLTLGVAALHGAGKIHRDIKPSNALVTPDGRVVILDLGLVADHSADTPSTGNNLVGTASYMAPEQALGRASPASDWYAVGAMLYHALCCQLPFAGTPFDILMQKQEREAPPVESVAPACPPDLADLCRDLLARDPEARPDARAILRRLDMSGTVELTPSSQASPPPFVGRSEELATLDAAYRASVDGATVTVLLHGRSGVGKTALIREFSRRVRAEPGERAPLILAGRCFENESLSFNAFDGVVDALSAHLSSMPPAEVSALLPDDASLLVRAFPVLAQVEAMASAGLPSDVRDPEELRIRMLTALRQIFRALAARAPVVLVIDDVQWANRDSLLLLTEITRPPRSPPLLLLINARGAAAPALELGEDVRAISVDPLPEHDAEALARSLLAGVGLPIDQAHAIAHEAEGHPMHIDALIRYAVDAPDDSGLPKLDQAIVARVGRLSDEARRLLELTCVAGAPVARAAMARAAALEGNDFDRAFAVLRLHHLARIAGVRPNEVIEPYHDRVRESVAASIAPDVRRAHHARLAVALEASGGDPELLMRHQAACGDHERAALTALKAAAAASDALAFDRAAELYNESLRLREPPPAERRDIHWRLSEALANAGRGDEAAESYLLAADGADKATRLECYRLAAEQWLMTGHIERGLDTLRELLGQIGGRYPASPGRAMASLLWSRAQLRLRGLGWKPRDASELGREHLTRVDAFRSVGQGIGMVDTIRGAAFQARGLMMALRAGEPSRIGRAFALESIFLASQGGRSIVRARKLLDRTAELARSDPYLEAWAVSGDGVIAYFEGRFEYAVTTLHQAYELWRTQPAGNTWEKSSVTVFQLLSLRLLGRVDDLHRMAREQARYARRRGDLYFETTVRRVTNLAWLCRDDAAGAHMNLQQSRWVPPEGRFHLQHWWENEARGELALYEGRAAETLAASSEGLARLRASLLTRVETVRIMALWLDGRLHLAAGADDPRNAARVRRVCRALERESVDYAAGFAAHLRAALCSFEGDVAGAIEHYRRVDWPGSLTGLVAQRRIAELTSDDAGLAQVDAAMAAMGVVSPQRVMRLFGVTS